MVEKTEERTQRLPEQELKRSLGASVRDGILYSIMAGLGDAYVPALLIFYGATDAAVGLLTSVPYALAAISQLFISRTMKAWRNRKKFVGRAVFLHAFFWLAQIAVIFSPLDNSIKIPASIALFGAYVGLFWFVSPAWSAWMADIVPESMRGEYFGHRNRMTGLALFLSTLAGGVVLGYFTNSAENVLLGFAVLFLAAFICRIGCAYFISRMAEPLGSRPEFRKVAWNGFLFGSVWKDARLFVLSVSLISFTRYVSAPFYSVFMLRNLGFTYTEFGMLTAAAVLFKILSFPYWGRLADKFGNRAVLVACGVLVSIIPLPWAFAARFDILLITQILAGFAWAGFELVSFNYIISAAPRDYRISLVSRYNFFNNVGIVAGASFGAFLLAGILPEALFGLVALQMLFFISSVLRMLVALSMLPRVKEQHAQQPYNDMGFMIDASIVYPARTVARQVARGLRAMDSAVKRVPRRIARIGADVGAKVNANAPLRGARKAAMDAFEKGKNRIKLRKR